MGCVLIGIIREHLCQLFYLAFPKAGLRSAFITSFGSRARPPFPGAVSLCYSGKPKSLLFIINVP